MFVSPKLVNIELKVRELPLMVSYGLIINIIELSLFVQII